MASIVLIALILFVLAAIAFAILRKRVPLGPDSAPWPFYAKKPLTQPEQVLYYRLVDALPECMVLAQVQLSRVLGVEKGTNSQQWINRIDRKSVDFLVCLKDSTVVAAVELDDKSHEKQSRIKADATKEKALSAAGITLIRWHVGDMPDVSTIRQAFAK